MNDTASMMFPIDADSVAADYLTFLVERVPKDLADQLDRDGQPDIGMPSETTDAADLVRPLSVGAFPTDKLRDVAAILGGIVIKYVIKQEIRLGRIGLTGELDDDDPYKMIYAASLYLYCFIRGGGLPPASGYLDAIRIVATIPLKLDVHSRLQIARFLASLVPMLPSDATDEPAPLSTLLLALSLVLGSVLSDLGVFAEQTIKSEHLLDAWTKEQAAEAASGLSYNRIAFLKDLLSDMHGLSGKVRQSADRFLVATGEESGLGPIN